MKRPFVFTGGTCIIASFLLPLYGGFISLAVFVAAIILIFCLMPKDRRLLTRFAIVAIILLLTGIRFVWVDLYISDKSAKLLFAKAEIEAIVTEVSPNDNISRFSLYIEDSSEEEAEGLSVSGYMYGTVDFAMGDRIFAEVTFAESGDRYKTYDFDSGRYFTVETESYYIIERSASALLSFADSVRKGTLKAVNSLGADDEADLLGSVIIGDKHSVGVNLNNYVEATGTSHMLVVSGLHLGIICGLLMRILKKRVNLKVTIILLLSFIVLFAVICLFHISVLRAGVAYIIMLMGMLAFRDSDPLNSLGLATTLLAFAFPYIFYNLAFMLSAAATFAVIGPAGTLLDTFRFGGKNSSPARMIARYIFETAVVAICALIFTLPLTVYYFGSSCLIAPLSNLFLCFSVTGMLSVGLLGVLLWFIPVAGKILSIPFIYIAKLFAGYFTLMVRLIAESGFGFIDSNPDSALYFGIFAAAFMLVVHFTCKYINSKKEIKPFAYRQDPEISP